ncbi:MAG: MFS transporter [Antricoccus sp.]
MATTTPVATAPAMTTAAPRRSTGAIVAILSLTGMAVSIMQTVVVPLLPQLSTILHTPEANTTWVLTITLLCGAVFTPLSGRLGDMFGKRNVLLMSVMAMIVGSVICALSSSLLPMLIGRAFQGASLGSIALGISLMRDALPKEKLPGAVALMSSTLGIGGAIGLPLSAIVAQNLSWHYLFWGSAALGALVFIAILAKVPESLVKTGGHFDYIGAVGLSAALVCLLFALSETSKWGWGDIRQLLLIAASVVIFIFWARYEKQASNPLVNIKTSISRPVLFTNAASIMVGFGMYSLNLVMTQLLQAPKGSGFGFGRSMVVAGLCAAPMGFAMMLVSPVAAGIIKRYGPRVALIIGPIIIAGGFVYAIVDLHYVWQAVVVSTLVGVGIAVSYAAMPTLIMRNVPMTETAAANSVNTLSRSLGTSLASAVHGAIIAAWAVKFAANPVPSTSSFSPFDLCFLLGAIACVMAIFFAVLIPRGQQRLSPLTAETEMLAGIEGLDDADVFADLESQQIGVPAVERVRVLERRGPRRTVAPRPAARPGVYSARHRR